MLDNRRNFKLSPLKICSRILPLALLLALLASAANSAGLGTPTEVSISTSNRRLTVAWSEIPGATSYQIAIRPKDQVVPAWREYIASSSPYTIADGWGWAMSGLQYEARVAAANAEGRSEWSAPVAMTAPVLQAAPADAIGVPLSPPLVGETASVDLVSQRPFANRSEWHWFICSTDGSDCKVLPRSPYRWMSGWEYFMEPAMQGKRVSVQVDYDKEGASYSATAVLGVVGAARTLATHLYDLQSAWVWLQWDRVRGGAIAPLGNDLLVAAPWGRLALVSSTGEVAYLAGNVPMNRAELQGHPDRKHFTIHRFRVADILLKQHSAGRYDLFVTHHYFTGDCLRFRLSATTLVQQGGAVAVASAWRTIFDAEPCLPVASGLLRGNLAGGRMLTDGPDHLLVVIGSHRNYSDAANYGSYAQAADSHLGKLVRVEIETGRAETLALGLRNPQGLARDADGTVWETEHGPVGGDELNVLVSGGNYGWPQVTYGVGDGGEVLVPSVEDMGHHDGFTKPVFAWVPAIGISSIIVNDERWFPLWKDDLLIASLIGRSLFRVRRDGADVQYVERIDIGTRIRDLAQMPDGRLALLDDSGRVHFLSRSYAHCADKSEWDRNVYAINCPDTVSAVAATGAQLYSMHCSGCHNLTVEQHGLGPHLVGVVGRRVGAVGGYLFSDALASLNEVWTPAGLERFLANPRQFAPGTAKPSLHLTPAEARAIADFIGD